jgi:nucleotidyltransferase/DNA polymerase involved in DNA repair
MTIGSVLIPRFALLVAVGGRREALTEPIALAPEPGREQAVGEASGAAEAFGIRPGMPVSEALGRCPQLVLHPPDPGRAAGGWERVVRRLESIGAGVESSRPGEAFFAVDGLRGICGPRREDVLARAGRAIGGPARIAGAPNRFCARAAATVARSRSPIRLVANGAERDFLAPLPVRLLDAALRDRAGRDDPAAGRLIATLERLGVKTLGDLAGLPRIAIADRFGGLGLQAHDLARGIDTPLRARTPHEDLVQAIGLPEAAYGPRLDRALDLLIERLLGDPRREGRSIRALSLEARLAGGGSWSATAVMRSASTSPERLRLAIAPKLSMLTAPATSLALRAVDTAPAGGAQPALGDDPGERRRERLAEAIHQVRAAAGRDAVLRVLDVDPGSRVPERWTMLAPYNDPGDGR